MSTHNPYAWLGVLAAQYWRQHDNAKKPRLSLVTPDQTLLNGRKPKMKTQQDLTPDLQKELATVLGGAFSIRIGTTCINGLSRNKSSHMASNDNVFNNSSGKQD